MGPKILIDTSDCSGCGACVEACRAGLISLVPGSVAIAERGCDGCLKCVQACPTGALSPVVEPEPASLIPTSSSVAPVTAVVHESKVAELSGLAGAALVVFGRELAPRLAEAFVKALERRWAQQHAALPPMRASSSAGQARVGRMRQRRRRGRGPSV
jgi:NAD-dependent dihydropyrimidine dehydrogenase PreA subunit